MRQDLPIVQSHTSLPVRNVDLERKLWRLMNDEGNWTGDDGSRSAPRTSAIMAGWVCVGFGLLTAWYFPPGHVFFSIGVIMAIVAMATHQVSQGLALLFGAMLGAGVCAAIFFALVMGNVEKALAAGLPPLPSSSGAFAPNSRFTALSAQPGSSGSVGTATTPLALNDLALMLRSGLRDDEIIADVAGKQLVDSISSAQTAYLRSLGAGNRLVANLQLRPVYARPAAVAVSSAPPQISAPSVPPNRPAPQAGVVSGIPASVAPAGAAANTMDPQLKQQRISQLKTQIDALDTQVRDIRANPKDSRYWYLYSGNANGLNQQALGNYLKSLDKQRNDLRREKWQLEGR